MAKEIHRGLKGYSGALKTKIRRHRKDLASKAGTNTKLSFTTFDEESEIKILSKVCVKTGFLNTVFLRIRFIVSVFEFQKPLTIGRKTPEGAELYFWHVSTIGRLGRFTEVTFTRR